MEAEDGQGWGKISRSSGRFVAECVASSMNGVGNTAGTPANQMGRVASTTTFPRSGFAIAFKRCGTRRWLTFVEEMAPLARPMLLKRACTAVPARRMIFTRPRAPIPTPSHSLSTKQRLVQNTNVRGVSPMITRIAAFHASGRRGILPPEPRKQKMLSAVIIVMHTTNKIAEHIEGTGWSKDPENQALIVVFNNTVSIKTSK